MNVLKMAPRWQRNSFLALLVFAVVMESVDLLDCAASGLRCGQPSQWFAITAPLLLAMMVSFYFYSSLKSQLVVLGFSWLVFSWLIAEGGITEFQRSSTTAQIIVMGLLVGAGLLIYCLHKTRQLRQTKDNWMLFRTGWVVLAALLFVNIPITFLAYQIGICSSSSGSSFGSSCSDSLVQFSATITQLITIYMIVFFAPIIIWVASLTLGVWNLKSMKVQTYFNHQLLLRLNQVSLVLLLTPLPLFAIMALGAIW